MKALSTPGRRSLWLAALVAGCATPHPPRELVEARQAMQRAEGGPASTLAPAELHVAKGALDRAEASFEESPNSLGTRDYAYVALRKIELAESMGRTAHASQLKVASAKELQKTQTEMLQQTQGALLKTRGQLEAERQGRLEAEKKAQSALEALERAGSVRKEARGLVITLSGSVLFPSGKANLLPSAQDRLLQVAQALKSQEERLVLVEGHTDSKGKEAANRELSQRRADAVKTFFIRQGIAEARMTAIGLGSTHPVTDNRSAEGRANNRRVEIVLQDLPAAPTTPPSPPPAPGPTEPAKPSE